MATAQDYLNLIQQSPALQRFLNLIGYAEGAGYQTGYGGRFIPDLSWHPYNVSQFRIVDPITGKQSTTSAAGKYQFERSTWNTVAKQLGLPDFSPQSQDIAATKLIADSGALNDVLSGNVQTAIGKLTNVWQGFLTHPIATLLNKYNAGSGLGGTTPTPISANNAALNASGDFSQYLGIPVIGEKNRYLVAFAILVIIFIFAFN